ncbi:uncharacterized protein LOC130677348 [Microplitis mediator]|uniref:uncharacterized protein LOC130677348 n=1 Tax=Microplitis mediator TaxID=375433 RepID=UPI00255256AB|nr:uncharacterized protein LOC130677348 [Microplitis mediator]
MDSFSSRNEPKIVAGEKIATKKSSNKKDPVSGTSYVLTDYDTDSVSSLLLKNSNYPRVTESNNSKEPKNGWKRLTVINSDKTNEGACSNCGLSKEYIDSKFTELFKKLDKMKFSLLYEVQKQGSNIQSQVIMNSSSSKAPNKSLSEVKEVYKEIFPFNDLHNFKNFDDKLNDESERNNLKSLFEVLTYGEKDLNACIRKTLSEVIAPAVQQHYSGAGRKIRGESKLNFSATKTYVCLSDVLLKKFGDSEQIKNLRSSVGSFLANFADRDGSKKKNGRKLLNL